MLTFYAFKLKFYGGGYMRLVRKDGIHTLYVYEWLSWIYLQVEVIHVYNDKEKDINYQRRLLLRKGRLGRMIRVCIYIVWIITIQVVQYAWVSLVSPLFFFFFFFFSLNMFLKFGWKLCLVQIHSYSFLKFD